MSADERAGPADALEGQVLQGTYRIVRRIRAGQIATTYEATHPHQTRKRFWIHIVEAGASLATEAGVQFRKEADRVAGLRHPHIAGALDVGVSERGHPYLVTEGWDGESLGAMLERGARLDQDRLALVMAQAAGALQAVHDAGLIHGNLNPDVIFLVDDGERGAPRVKLLEVGFYRLQDPTTAASQGDLYYLSPERARGQPPQRPSDLFTLGVICYQCLCGAVPFFGGSPEEILDRICLQSHKAPTAHDARLHPGVDQFFARALAKEPADRFPQARILAEMFYKALSGKYVATVFYGDAAGRESNRTLVDGPPAAGDTAAGRAGGAEDQAMARTLLDGPAPQDGAGVPSGRDVAAGSLATSRTALAGPGSPAGLVVAPDPSRVDVYGATVPPGTGNRPGAGPPAVMAGPRVDVYGATVAPSPGLTTPSGAPQPAPPGPRASAVVVGEIHFERAPKEEERTDVTTVPKGWSTGAKVALGIVIGMVLTLAVVAAVVVLFRG